MVSDKVKEVFVYNTVENGAPVVKCDVKYEDGEIVYGVMWETFPLDTDVILHDQRAVNPFYR